MKKKLLFTLAVMVLGLLAFGAVCASAATSGIYTYTVSNGQATITDCSTSASGKIVIPDTLGGYPVTGIGGDAFYNCTKLTGVTIPSSITNIGENAFSGCTGLTRVDITDISAWCKIDFAGWRGNPLSYAKKLYLNGELVTRLDIPDGVTSIGDYAFHYCTGFTSVTIPDSVTSIGYEAFYGCSGLTRVDITDISAWCKIEFGGYASNPLYWAKKLYLNGELVTDLVIPDGVTSIGYEAFEGCTGLTSVTIPDSVTSIGFMAFDGCTGLTSVNIPDGVTSIEATTFAGCTGLTSVTIPDSVTSIEIFAFNGCTGLTSVTIPDGVTSIGYSAFGSCYGLTSVTIPDSVTSIGEDAFSCCIGLTSVTIGDGVTSIGEYAFASCPGLTSITIPDSVTSIEAFAFSGCTGLTSVTIGDSVTNIGGSAFLGCTGLTQIHWNAKNVADFSSSYRVFANAGQNGDGISVIFGENVESIPAHCFDPESGSNYAPKITSVTIGNHVKSIGAYAFYGCTGLTSVAIPDSVKSIGTSAFPGNTELTSVTNLYDYIVSNGQATITACAETASGQIVIPGTLDGYPVTGIGDYAFYGCTGITGITIPASVTSIGEYAFSACAGLTRVDITDINAWCKIDFAGADSNPLYWAGKLYLNGKLVTNLVIPDGVTSIGNYAFTDYGSLTSVTIGDSVTSIGDYAFNGCVGLTSVTMSESVTSIGSFAFWSCIGLKNITIPDKVTSIGEFAFSLCTELTSVTLPNSVKSIGAYAFFGCDGLSVVNYNGDEVAWKAISIGDGNTELTQAKRNYFWRVNLFFENGVKNSVSCTPNAACDFSIIPEQSGYIAKVYCDEKRTKAFDTSTPITSNIDLYVYYEINQYTYKFLDEDGAVLKAVTADCGAEIKPPSEPSKASTIQYSYVFAGWEGYTDGMKLTGDISFTAKYTEVINQYTYQFTDEKGSVLKKVTADYGTKIVPADEPSKASTAQYSYIFAGWVGYTDGMLLTGDISFAAKYTVVINQYTYQFTDEDGTVLKKVKANYGTKIVPADEPSKASTVQYSYTFAGWVGYTEGMKLTGDISFTAKYTEVINQYTYQFTDKDGAVLKELTADYGTVIEPPANPGDKGAYTFDYWQGYSDGMTITADVTFKAMYKYKSFSITAEGLTNPVTVTYNSHFTIEPQKKDDYNFVGYYTGKDGKGTQVTNEKGESINVYDVVGNLNVYPYFVAAYMNKIELQGTTAAMPGDIITQKAIYATDKNAGYLVATVKYPSFLSLKHIQGVDFTEASKDSEKTVDGYTYLDITCIYDYKGGNAPINTNLVPFALEFDVATDAPIGNIEISLKNVALVGDASYDITKVGNQILEINPKLAESIGIVGKSEIDAATQFSAVVSPDYTTDKSVEWSVNDEAVASITQDGTVTPLKNGTVTITATATDGSEVFATKTVNVIAYAKIDGLNFGDGVVFTEFNPDVRDYTVYVKEDATSITLTPVFSGGGVLRANGSGAWVSGRSKDFELSDAASTIITLNRENVTDKTNRVYTVTVVRFEGTKTRVSDDGQAFTVTPVNIENGKTVLLALYDGDDFVEMQTAIYRGKELTFTTDQAYTDAKVMVWDSLVTLMPACDAEFVK